MTSTLAIPARDCPLFSVCHDQTTGRCTLRINAAVGDAHCFVELDADGLASLRHVVNDAWDQMQARPIDGVAAQSALFADVLRQVAEPQHHAACNGGINSK